MKNISWTIKNEDEVKKLRQTDDLTDLQLKELLTLPTMGPLEQHQIFGAQHTPLSVMHVPLVLW